MTDPMPSPAAQPWAAGARRSLAPAATALVVALALAACVSTPSGSPVSTSSVSASATPESTPEPTPQATAIETAEPTATPEPPLSLDLPADADPRRVAVTVAPEVPVDGDGRIVVTVTSLSDERITELVLRWPTTLRETLFLAPFEPSQQRIADGGPPLWQEWTKWVEGPGERGEPAGTTSLGWGPLDAGATLTIPILVTRNAAGPVDFDFQVLAGEAILGLEDGTPAELRVQVP
ncbi:MAG TPA: hypothetical protein VF071_03865 [Candidatus Limnocylindria bacterium]